MIKNSPLLKIVASIWMDIVKTNNNNNDLLNASLKGVKRMIIAVVGFTILLVGLVMVVTPGPAILVILIGLGILSSEFLWARRLIHKLKNKIKQPLS